MFHLNQADLNRDDIRQRGNDMYRYVATIIPPLLVSVSVAVAVLSPLGQGQGLADQYPTSPDQSAPLQQGPDDEAPPTPYLPIEKQRPGLNTPGNDPWGAPDPSIALESAGRDGDGYGPVDPRDLTPDSPFVADELLVQFRAGVTPNDRQAVHGRFGASEVARLEGLNAFQVQLPTGSDLPALARAYEDHPLVALAQPNYQYTTFVEPTDPAYTDLQHWYYNAINAPAGWDVKTGDANIIIAVVDTGVDLTHPDLDDQLWVNTGETPGNGIDDDGNGCVDDVNGCDFTSGTPNGNPDDDIGHGTFVAGVACGETNNGVSGAGTAFDCTIMPVKVLSFGHGSSADIAEGILYAAENGADIINLSLGSGCIPGGEAFTDPLMEAAMATAHDTYGATIVAAAGNSNQSCVGFPASDPNAIAVGASGFLNAVDGRAPFSQWGPEIDVAAPGVNIVSATPPGMCGYLGPCLSDGITSVSSGTSFSTPQVAGLAALLLSQDPSLTNEELRTIIRSTARDLPDGAAPNWDGAGRIDVGAALGGESVFATVDVSHGFLPAFQLSVGIGDPSAPDCEFPILNFIQIITSAVNGSFGMGECASFWPPSESTPWFLRALDDDLFPDLANIEAWSLESTGLLCSAFDTPVAIPDNDPAGGVSVIECPPTPELIIDKTAPLIALVGDQMDYQMEVTNIGGATAGPSVFVVDTLPAETELAGSAGGVCSVDDSTVTCNLGSIDSGQSASVVLTVDANSAGIVTNCATVDPDSLIADEVDPANNTDCAETEIIQIPVPTFTNADPTGDIFGFSGMYQPDIIEIRGAFDADTFYLTVKFAGPVDPADAETGQEVMGLIDFDIDQNPATGFTSSTQYYCSSPPNTPPGMTGTDIRADLFGVSNGSLPLRDYRTYELVGHAPIIFSDNAFTAFLPLSPPAVIGGDNSLDFTMALGSHYGPTDCAPNGTVISCNDGLCDKIPPLPPPENDDFASVELLLEPLSPPMNLGRSTIGATLEPDEPQPCGGIDNTVWYSFTPSTDMLLVADTFQSNFDTVLAVYTGDTLQTLDAIECNDDAVSFLPGSQVSFAASAGVTYYFQAGGYFGGTGNLAFHLAGTSQPDCDPWEAPESNNSFESGPVWTNLIPCWTVVDQENGFGSWCNQSGRFTPQGDCAGSYTAVPSAPAGIQTAMSNGFGPGSHLLYRCGVLESATLSFELALINSADDFYTPLSLDYRRVPNQQFRADLVTAAGMILDPFTLDPADILLNIYQTQPGDPLSSGFDLIAADVTPYMGQEVCLRFTEVDTQHFLRAGVDDVQFGTGKNPNGDSDGDNIPNGLDPDDDNDGCMDEQELGTSATLGGQRDPHNFWDFFDTPTGTPPQRDRAVTIADVGAVVSRFGTTGDPGIHPLSTPPATGYHTAFDRSPLDLDGGPWNLGPADGAVIIGDIGAVVAQFGHSCVETS